MSKSSDNIARWQKELEDAFRGPRGLVGERLCRLQDAERQTQSDGIARYNGYATVGDAFFDFAIQTLDFLANPVGVYHILRVPLFVSSISRLRASYVLFWMGYYFDAASLLRGTFENAVHLCADAHGWADLNSWFDVSGIDLAEPAKIVTRKMHKRRLKHDHAVEAKVFRRHSGLSQVDQDQLAMAVNLMHAHVHKTEMHLVHLILEVKRTKTPTSVVPAWDNHRAAHYAHISLWHAWMFTRLLSYAVPQEKRSSDWTGKREVLDRSLRSWFEDWDKPLAATIIRLMDAKFAFSGEWKEPDPSTDT